MESRKDGVFYLKVGTATGERWLTGHFEIILEVEGELETIWKENYCHKAQTQEQRFEYMKGEFMRECQHRSSCCQVYYWGMDWVYHFHCVVFHLPRFLSPAGLPLLSKFQRWIPKVLTRMAPRQAREPNVNITWKPVTTDIFSSYPNLRLKIDEPHKGGEGGVPSHHAIPPLNNNIYNEPRYC